MSNTSRPLDIIQVDNLRLWAHVGVLDFEREQGQWFRVDLELHLDLSASASADSLSATADYSLGIQALQRLAAKFSCHTLEHFSERMFEVLEELYGPLPMHLQLSKCDPPIPGFAGTVSLQRWRRKPF